MGSMKTLQLNTTSRQLWLFMLDYSYTEKALSKVLDMAPATISYKLHNNNWSFDQVQAIRKLFAKHGVEFIGEVSVKVKIKRNESNI